jgi:hypothetical protein
MLPLLMLSLLSIPGCFSGPTKYVVAKSTKDSEETTGFIRIVSAKKLMVAQIGPKETPVGTVDLTTKKYPVLIGGAVKEIDATAYILFHEVDATQFVKNTIELQKLKADPEIAEIIKRKNILAMLLSDVREYCAGQPVTRLTF